MYYHLPIWILHSHTFYHLCTHLCNYLLEHQDFLELFSIFPYRILNHFWNYLHKYFHLPKYILRIHQAFHFNNHLCNYPHYKSNQPLYHFLGTCSILLHTYLHLPKWKHHSLLPYQNAIHLCNNLQVSFSKYHNHALLLLPILHHILLMYFSKCSFLIHELFLCQMIPNKYFRFNIFRILFHVLNHFASLLQKLFRFCIS